MTINTSWLLQISTRIKFCPLDWRTTIHWNVVLEIFQHNHICQDCWKNTRSTFESMVIIKSMGQCPKEIENYGTNLSHTSSKNLDLVPRIGEKPYTQMLILYFSNNLDIYHCIHLSEFCHLCTLQSIKLHMQQVHRHYIGFVYHLPWLQACIMYKFAYRPPGLQACMMNKFPCRPPGLQACMVYKCAYRPPGLQTCMMYKFL
jgi:hypothetical protein